MFGLLTFKLCINLDLKLLLTISMSKWSLPSSNRKMLNSHGWKIFPSCLLKVSLIKVIKLKKVKDSYVCLIGC